MLKPTLPPDDHSLVVRTDFGDEAAWQRVCAEIQAPQTSQGFQAMVECISDRVCDGLGPEAVCRLVPDTDVRLIVLIVDSTTFARTAATPATDELIGYRHRAMSPPKIRDGVRAPQL